MRDKAYLNTQSLTKSPGESLTGLDTSVGGHSSRKSNSKIFTILSFATNKTYKKNKFISNGCLVIKPKRYVRETCTNVEKCNNFYEISISFFKVELNSKYLIITTHDKDK